MLKAFIDDSRMNQPPVYVLGGWIAPPKVWAPFSDEWDKVLRMSPRIEYFKFSEAMNFLGQFNGMTEESRNQKLSLLVSLIAEYKLLGAASIIPHNLFQMYFGHNPDLNNPYHPSLLGLVSRVVRYYRDQGIKERIEFFFDHQPGQMAVAEAGWELFRETLPADCRDYVTKHPPGFLDDKDIVALQAADLCAGRVRMLNEASFNGVKPTPPPWGDHGADIPSIQIVWTPSLAKHLYEELYGHKPLMVSYRFGHGVCP